MTSNGPTGLAFLRHCAGVSQARMAELMGVKLRTYEDIEAGRSKYRPIHLAAAQWALLHVAVERGDRSVLTGRLRDFVDELAMLKG